MKAMILAAGLGTRLRPFTLEHPKALFVVEGKTLLEHALNHLREAGVTSVIINLHHFASQIIDYIRVNNEFGFSISFSDETGELLETGGGLKKAAWFFEPREDFILRNVDIISNLDFKSMLDVHNSKGSIATLAVRNRNSSRYFLFNDCYSLCGWENLKTGQQIRIGDKELSKGEQINPLSGRSPQVLKPYAFSGIQILSSSIFPMIIEDGKFSLVDLYLRLAASCPINGYLDNSTEWKDIGTTF